MLHSHHSRDLHFLSKIRQAIAEMAQQQKNQGWYCVWCRVMNGKHAICCHRCGGKWYEVGDEDATEEQNYAPWSRSTSRRRTAQDAQQRPKSPRKGKGKGKGKPDHGEESTGAAQPRRRSNRRKGKTDTPARPEAPGPPVLSHAAANLPQMGADAQSWMALLQSQKAALQAQQPLEDSTTSASTSAPSQLPEVKKLLQSLRKEQDKLSPESQELVKTMTIKEEKKEEKDLQSAAKSLGKARRDLQEAFNARNNLHQKWRNFLSMSVAQWQAFTTEFQTQEQAAMDQIKDAREALTLAKANLEVSQAPFQSPKAKEAIPGDVEDLMSDDEAQEDTGAQKLQEGLQNLTTSLQGLHKMAQDAHAEEQAAKRARLDGPADPASLPGGKALQPFPSPGAPRP